MSINAKIVDHVSRFSEEDGQTYKKFFKSALSKFGINSPAELDDKKKKDFFDYIDSNYKAKNEAEVSELVVNPAVIQQFKDRAIADHGKKVKISTALGNKNHPAHKKAKGLWQSFKDRILAKKKEEPKKEKPKKKSASANAQNAALYGGNLSFESTDAYEKTLDKMAKDQQLKMISKKDKDTLRKIADLMKKANEAKISVEPNWEGMWRFFKHMAKTNVGAWYKIQRAMGNEWIKLNKMASKEGWVAESVNEARQLRVGEAAKKGRWEVYDNKTDKTIKVVANAGAATRLMNRLMDSGKYTEVAAKWIGDEKDESVNEALPKPLLRLSKSQIRGMIKRAKRHGARGYDIIKSLSKDLSVTDDQVVSTLEKHRLIGMTESTAFSGIMHAPGKGPIYADEIEMSLKHAVKKAGFRIKKYQKMKWGYGGVGGAFITVDGGEVLPFHVKKDRRVSYDASAKTWIIGFLHKSNGLIAALKRIKKIEGYGQDVIQKKEDLQKEVSSPLVDKLNHAINDVEALLSATKSDEANDAFQSLRSSKNALKASYKLLKKVK